MSTRSAIIMEVYGGYKGIYCHSDGYIERPGVGSTLLEHYKYQAKINKLINLGNISYLAPNTIDTRAYHRDMKEDKDGPYYGMTVEDVLENIDFEYAYIYQNGKWYVDIPRENVYNKDLQEALKEILKEKPKKTYKCVNCGEPIYPTWYKGCNIELQADWKHEANKELDRLEMWSCYKECDGDGFAKAPPDAIWTEPSKKEDGAH